jgi:hypothetical protein
VLVPGVRPGVSPMRSRAGEADAFLRRVGLALDPAAAHSDKRSGSGVPE